MLAAQRTPGPASTTCGTTTTISVNWAQFGFDSCHSKFNPREVTIGRSNVSNLVVAWKYATGGPINSYPTIFNGVVYVGSNDGFLYAINVATGALLWSYSIGNEFGAAAVGNGLVFASSDKGVLYALNASTGQLVWTHPGADSPTLVNGVVYVGYYDAMYAVDARTGATLWRRSGLLGGSAVFNGRVYVLNSDNHTVDALNATTGDLIWQSMLVFGTGPLAVANDSVIVDDGFDQALYALDAQTGAYRWGVGMEDLQSPVAVAYGEVYFGIKLWRTDTPYVLQYNALTGAGGWVNSTAHYVYPLLVANGVLYGSGEDNNLYAFNTDTGAVLWSHSIGTHPTTAALVNGSLFIGGSDGNLYALRLAN